MANKNYIRVIPRDLFNEAKLLKCIGRLCLLIHDRTAPEGLEFEHEGGAFEIELMDEGALFIGNIFFSIGGRSITVKSTYNSKANYPLFAEVWDSEEIEVFDEAGNFTGEFKAFCNSLKNEGGDE